MKEERLKRIYSLVLQINAIIKEDTHGTMLLKERVTSVKDYVLKDLKAIAWSRYKTALNEELAV